MDLIKTNKVVLLLAFFLPFCASMCSRTDFIQGQQEVYAFPKAGPIQQQNEHSVFLAYLFYPTEHSLNGFGITYYLFAASQKEWSFLLLIPFCLFISIVGLLLTFFQANRVLLPLSVLSFGSFLILVVKIVLENSSPFLWGFWIAFALSCLDIFLLSRKLLLKPGA